MIGLGTGLTPFRGYLQEWLVLKETGAQLGCAVHFFGSRNHKMQSRWACLPPELLHDVVKRLEASESIRPSRKDAVACTVVCISWREMWKEIVGCPEFSGRFQYLKQLGHQDGTIQSFLLRGTSQN